MSFTTTQTLSTQRVSKQRSAGEAVAPEAAPTLGPESLTVVEGNGWNRSRLPTTDFFKPYTVDWETLSVLPRELNFGKTNKEFTELQIFLAQYYGCSGIIHPVAGWTAGGWDLGLIFKLVNTQISKWNGFYAVLFDNCVLDNCSLQSFLNTATLTIGDFLAQDPGRDDLHHMPALADGAARMKKWEMPFIGRGGSN
ncbi:hypothetical protein C8R47DRAFT_1206894 [Mycena vitilis]|nr:hypothetical protein C8R47DRAFT_1206894 [Mycena vitilis]